MTLVEPATARRGHRRGWIVALAGILLVALAGLLVRAWLSNPHGDPDPGHRRIDALRPVLGAVPTPATITSRDVVGPHWDSCDGKHPGWDDATVDAGFTSPLDVATVVARIGATLTADGWTYDRSSKDGSWYWRKSVEGATAVVQLLGGPEADPPGWDLQATVPAAINAISC